MKIANTYNIPVPTFGKAAGSSLLAVLAREDCGPNLELYACYIGIVNLPLSAHDLGYRKARAKLAARVASSGHKLNCEQAKQYFPSITENIYRR